MNAEPVLWIRLSRIRIFSILDPGSEFFPSWIPDPNSFHPGSRIRIKEIKYFGLFIPDPDPDFLPIPDPGSRGQKGTGSRIRIYNTAQNATDYHILGVEGQKIYMVYVAQRTSCLRSSTTAASLPNLLPIGAPLFRNVDLLEMFRFQKSKKISFIKQDLMSLN